MRSIFKPDMSMHYVICLKKSSGLSAWPASAGFSLYKHKVIQQEHFKKSLTTHSFWRRLEATGPSRWRTTSGPATILSASRRSAWRRLSALAGERPSAASSHAVARKETLQEINKQLSNVLSCPIFLLSQADFFDRLRIMTNAPIGAW